MEQVDSSNRPNRSKQVYLEELREGGTYILHEGGTNTLVRILSIVQGGWFLRRRAYVIEGRGNKIGQTDYLLAHLGVEPYWNGRWSENYLTPLVKDKVRV
jgi:hypothetical protein